MFPPVSPASASSSPTGAVFPPLSPKLRGVSSPQLHSGKQPKAPALRKTAALHSPSEPGPRPVGAPQMKRPVRMHTVGQRTTSTPPRLLPPCEPRWSVEDHPPAHVLPKGASTFSRGKRRYSSKVRDEKAQSASLAEVPDEPWAVIRMERELVDPGELLEVHWEATALGMQQKQSAFNFLALHRSQDHFLAYVSSFYTMGELNGSASLYAPSRPGSYRFTLVRDLDEEQGKLVNSWTQEAEALGSAEFVVWDPDAIIESRPNSRSVDSRQSSRSVDSSGCERVPHNFRLSDPGPRPISPRKMSYEKAWALLMTPDGSAMCREEWDSHGDAGGWWGGLVRTITNAITSIRTVNNALRLLRYLSA